MMEIITVFSALLALAAFVFGYFQHRRTKRAMDYFRSGAWNLFHRFSNALGQIQKSLNLYKVNPESQDALEHLIRADAHCQDIFVEIIQVIQHAEPNFDEAQIGHWIETKRIPEDKGKWVRQIVVQGVARNDRSK